MLDDVNKIGSNILNSTGNASVSRLAGVAGSAYSTEGQKVEDFIDEGQISPEAIAKYEKEVELAKYKSIVLEMLQEDGSSEEVSSIADLINNDNYDVENSDLADSILQDDDARSLLF